MGVLWKEGMELKSRIGGRQIPHLAAITIPDVLPRSERSTGGPRRGQLGLNMGGRGSKICQIRGGA